MTCYCETFVSVDGFRITHKIRPPWRHPLPGHARAWKTIATNKKRVECDEEYPELVEKLQCKLCRHKLLCLIEARAIRTFESI